MKIKKATSSKKKIADVWYVKGDSSINVRYGSAKGTTTIKVKTNKGTAKLKFKVTYICPVKSFKVAGKSYTKKFKKTPLCTTKKTLKKKKFTVKAKKNWVITGVSTVKWSYSASPKYSFKSVDDKKTYSGKITIKKLQDGVTVSFKNTKTGDEQSVSFERYSSDVTSF